MSRAELGRQESTALLNAPPHLQQWLFTAAHLGLGGGGSCLSAVSSDSRVRL